MELTLAGRGDAWDMASGTGNPALAPTVSDYISGIADEQVEAHVPIKQAVPIFPDKIMRLAGYLSRELQQKSLSAR